jgi:outer membrane murein-binding lipoprotein Lpp
MIILLSKILILEAFVLACLLFGGCASVKDNEVNAIKFEKHSTASEVDQYVTTAGRVFRFIGLNPDAK